MENPVIILGATRLGRIALDIFNSHGIMAYCFLDDDASLHNTEINEVVVMGKTTDDGYLKFVGQKCEAFVAVEDVQARQKLLELLKNRRKVMPVNAVHQLAYLAPTAHLGYGNLVGAGAVVNPNAKIDFGCVVDTRAVIDCEAVLEPYVQVGAGAVVGAKAQLGQGAYIGAGAVIGAGVKVGKMAQVAPGAVVLQDVAPESIVFGNPAKSSR
jgi:sugar O-acyltransferase (sialic acid O-acetyltransferase NeuD family)